MNTTAIQRLARVGGLALAPVLAAATPAWPTFRSTHGFAVQYPGTWVRIGSENGLGVSATRLELRSSHGCCGGVVICVGQAWLGARAAFDTVPDLAALITAETRDRTVLRRDAVSGGTGAGTCPTFDRLDTRWTTLPRGTTGGQVPSTAETWLFCQVGARRFVLHVANYAGDRREAEYRAILLRVARTLRF